MTVTPYRSGMVRFVAIVFVGLVAVSVNMDSATAQQSDQKDKKAEVQAIDNCAKMPDFSEIMKNKPDMKQIMKDQMESFGGMWGRMTEEMIAATLNVLSKPETAEKMATFTKNYVDALMANGFSREEALRIATSVHLTGFSGK